VSAAFTPGPWELHRHSTTSVIGSKGFVVAACGGHSNNMADPDELAEELQANARLIAAAPDLYDAADMALNTLLGCCVSAGGVDDRKTILEAQAMLRAAIAKAEAAS
jgi:hypothetical protein